MFPNKERGFLTYSRQMPGRQPAEERLKHCGEFEVPLTLNEIREQGYRCMDCGVPFCHSGCPLGNIIPDFNDKVKDDDWVGALEILHSTNNFPEVTGRVCPAPCESSCVLGINQPAVTIKLIEREIVERAWADQRITPEPALVRTGKRIAVVGSGPAGLAAAQQLARAGHDVVVYERSDVPGGLLVYGIPDFKMEKFHIERRVQQMRSEGVDFQCTCEIGKDIPAQKLVDDFDAVLLTVGSTVGRELDIPGRELSGIHLAMDYLVQQNRAVAGLEIEGDAISATGKKVLVLGGGDTGSDCHGTALRQGAKEVCSLELLAKPPEDRNDATPWPSWPLILRTSSSHEEGGNRDWGVLTKSFEGEDGKVRALNCVRLDWSQNGSSGGALMKELAGTEFTIEADLVLLALGFIHPEQTLAGQLNLDTDDRGNYGAPYEGAGAYRTSVEKVWAAGDARRGQSLVVWAIHEGREAAHAIDRHLMGFTDLPSINSFGYDQISL